MLKTVARFAKLKDAAKNSGEDIASLMAFINREIEKPSGRELTTTAHLKFRYATLCSGRVDQSVQTTHHIISQTFQPVLILL